MSALEARKIGTVNGLDVDALRGVIDEVKNNPSKGIVEFKVKTGWKGQTRSEANPINSPAMKSNAASRSTPTSPSSYWARTPLPIRRNC
jgi:hypothetical protein